MPKRIFKRKPLPTEHLDNGELKKNIIESSSHGQSRSSIVRTLGLSHNFFAQYQEAYDWYLEGRELLTQKVRTEIFASLETSFLDRKLLVTKLDLFYEPFDVMQIRTPDDARQVIGDAIKHFAEGSISSDTLNTLSKSALTFIESYNQTVLMKEIDQLKQLLKERK